MKSTWQHCEYGPGSITAFCGSGFMSRMIELFTTNLRQKFTGEWISHVGICCEYKANLIHIESTTLGNLPCIIKGHKIHGVQANHLWDRVDSYDGCVWIMNLVEREKLTAEQSKRLTDFLVSMLGTPYNMEGALLAGTHWAKQLFMQSGAQVFCDQLDAMALFDCGKVARTFDPGTITPAWLVNYLRHIGAYTITRIK